MQGPAWSCVSEGGGLTSPLSRVSSSYTGRATAERHLQGPQELAGEQGEKSPPGREAQRGCLQESVTNAAIGDGKNETRYNLGLDKDGPAGPFFTCISTEEFPNRLGPHIF